MVVACWLAHVFCHGKRKQDWSQSEKSSEPERRFQGCLLVSRAECGVPERPPVTGSKVVSKPVNQIFSGGSRFPTETFLGFPKLVYLVVDPA